MEMSAMTTRHRSILGTVALCAILATTTFSAKAQDRIQILSKGQEVGIVAGIAGAGAAVGIGIYFAVHHGHSLRGCAVSGPNGLQLQNQGDQQTYALTGEVADIKPGDRVRVSGKKEKKSAGDPQDFLVAKLTKDYGACKEQPAPALSAAVPAATP